MIAGTGLLDGEVSIVVHVADLVLAAGTAGVSAVSNRMAASAAVSSRGRRRAWRSGARSRYDLPARAPAAWGVGLDARCNARRMILLQRIH